MCWIISSEILLITLTFRRRRQLIQRGNKKERNLIKEMTIQEMTIQERTIKEKAIKERTIKERTIK